MISPSRSSVAQSGIAARGEQPTPAARRRLGRLLGAGAGVVLVAAGAAGCGSGSTSSHGHAASQPISPVKAISLAATTHPNSLAATINIASASLPNPVTATMRAQFKPTTFIDMTLNGISAAGSPPTSIEEILTSDALYLKDSALTKLTKKPWVKITFAQLSSKAGINLSSLLQNLESSNPENQVKLFAISKDIHVVGTQTINGVATTEYAGTYLPSAAAAKLPAALRKLLGPALALMGNTPVKFHVWLDAQHLTRKAVVDETIDGHPLVTTYTITSINQPVDTTLPPASQVGSLP